jgi:hypothetical protein
LSCKFTSSIEDDRIPGMILYKSIWYCNHTEDDRILGMTL